MTYSTYLQVSERGFKTGKRIGTTTSAGEKVAEWAKGARVVKAFNTVGFNIIAESGFPGGEAALFYCGDDAEAKKVVARLAVELGFEALDAGPLTQSRVLEPFAMLWTSLCGEARLRPRDRI